MYSTQGEECSTGGQRQGDRCGDVTSDRIKGLGKEVTVTGTVYFLTDGLKVPPSLRIVEF